MHTVDICYLYCSAIKFDATRPNPGFGADVVMLDLEDAVFSGAKADARHALVAFADAKHDLGGQRIGVRVNRLSCVDGLRDLELVHGLLASERLTLDYLQFPKVDSPEELALGKSILRDLNKPPRLFPLVETPAAVEAVRELAALSDAMLFGEADLRSTMYMPNEAYLARARGDFCVACAGESIPALDTYLFQEVKDMDAYEEACLKARSEGFTGKAMIHPRQVPVAKRVFTPSPEELAACRRKIELYESAAKGFEIVDGQVVAPPFVARAKLLTAFYGGGATGEA